MENLIIVHAIVGVPFFVVAALASIDTREKAIILGLPVTMCVGNYVQTLLRVRISLWRILRR